MDPGAQCAKPAIATPPPRRTANTAQVAEVIHFEPGFVTVLFACARLCASACLSVKVPAAA